MKNRIVLFVIGLVIGSSAFGQEPKSDLQHNLTSSENLFIPYKVWNIHMGFTLANWDYMSPENKFKPVSEGGGGGGFGPGGFIAPAFIVEGDMDGNGQLSEDEFAALGRRWYTTWDEEGNTGLGPDEIDEGFHEVSNKVTGGKLVLSGAKGERNGIASVLGIEYPSTLTNLEFGEQHFDSATIRHKGNGTYLNAMGTNKLPFKIDLNDGYPGRKLGGVVKINLHNNITDPSYMNDVIAHQLFRDAGVPAPRTTYARVHVTVPDLFDREYFGLYSIVENVDKRFISDRYGTRKGAILKPVTPFLFRDLGDQWEAYNQIYDPKTELTDEEKWRLIDLCRIVTHASDYEFAERIGDFIELDETARFLAVSVLICDLDGILGPGQNFYLYLHPKTGKFTFIPWDQDHSFGQMNRTQEQREQLSIHRPWTGDNLFLERLYGVDAFKEAYVAHMQNFNDSLFQPIRINAQIEELASSIRPALQDDSPEKLLLFNRLVSWDSHHNISNVLAELKEAGANIPPPSHGSFGYDTEVKPIRGFVVERTKSVEDQLAGRSDGLEDVLPGETVKDPYRSFFSSFIIAALDKDKDGHLTEKEIDQGFAEWYASWNKEDTESLTDKELKAGLTAAMQSVN